MWEQERWSNRKTKDEQNKRVLRQNIQRHGIKRDIKENRCRVKNTILMDIWSKPTLSPFKLYYLNGGLPHSNNQLYTSTAFYEPSTTYTTLKIQPPWLCCQQTQQTANRHLRSLDSVLVWRQ